MYFALFSYKFGTHQVYLSVNIAGIKFAAFICQTSTNQIRNMNKLFYAITVIAILYSCSKDDNLPAFELAKPVTITVFCPNSLNDTISQTDYEYDLENLIKMTLRNYGEIKSITNYEYNSGNQLIKETWDQYFRKTEITYIYNKSDQLINKLYKTADLDANGQVLSTNEFETPLEYKNNRLFKDVETWGGWNTYEYTDGKVTTKNVFTSTGQLYWIIKYKYSGSLKVEEKKQTSGGNNIYTRSFEYDSEGRLTKVIEDGNIIEQNTYDGNKLIEKRTMYYGIDPGFSACGGSFTYKFEYRP